ncbi:MAG: hypothetical protein K2N28_04975 [Muribaculaceae bacterium]|nr:hypothetical protein [Muribaculaceae bacterium]
MKQPSYLKGGLLLIGIAFIVSLISVSEEFGMWLTVTLLVLGGLTLLYSLSSQFKKALVKPAHRLYAKDFSLKFMATLMGFFLILGTLLYIYVFYTIGHDALLANDPAHTVQFSNAEYLLRSLICSLDLFMLDLDSNILDRLDGHAALKGWLAIQAVLSFACTVAMLVGLVYSRLHAYYRLNYATRITDSKNHLYLFFGNNKPSESLIKDIVKNDPKVVAIIIDEANLKEDNNDEWEGIVSLIAHKQKVFKTADKIGAHVAIASQQPGDIDEAITSREDFDAFGYLGLSQIKKFIHRLSQTSHPQLHIFFMGEDEELNIRNIIALAKDVTIMSIANNKDLYHRIYCHARYNGPNRVIQDVALKKHLNIKIVDSSHLAIELLKLDSGCHPVNVVKMSDKNLATVESPLKTMIVGFGEVGRDAFRFLYEFGAFVNSNDPNTRSPFECVIVDKNLDDIKGTFKASMPGIFKPYRWVKMWNPSIRFENVDYNSEEFYNNVLYRDKFLEEVNYIVISIGDNDEAIALAARIFTKIRRVREDVSDLRIFVRCTDDNKVEGIQKIADHYNCGYGDGEKNTPVIHVFGQPDKIYTYELVVSDRLVEEGKQFHEKYRVLSGGGDSWDDRHKQLTETTPPNIEKLRKLRRQESQDRANALHAGTKMIILKEAMTGLCKDNQSTPDWYSFYLRYFNADGSANVAGSRTTICYPELSDRENEIILRLAQLEHLRWNAAHELMGYVFNEDGTSCDERTMKHNCLCPWDKLDTQSSKITGWPCDYKKYDFCVVDTTVALNKDNLLYPKSND